MYVCMYVALQLNMTADAKEWAGIALHNAELLYQLEGSAQAGAGTEYIYVCMYVRLRNSYCTPLILLGKDGSGSGGSSFNSNIGRFGGTSAPSQSFRYHGERRQVLRELAELHREYALRCDQVGSDCMAKRVVYT